MNEESSAGFATECTETRGCVAGCCFGNLPKRPTAKHLERFFYRSELWMVQNRTATDDHIRLTCKDRLNQFSDIRSAVLVVCIGVH